MLKSLFYTTLSGGLLNGVIGYELEFDGTNPTNEQIADVILKIRDHKAKQRVVYLKGSFPKDEIIMVRIIEAFRSLRYEIIAEVSDGVFHQWQKGGELNYVIGVIDDPKWIPFNCNELRFKINSPLTAEPSVPDQIPRLYLIPEGLSKEETFKWINGAKKVWHLNIETEKIGDEL